MTDPSRMTTNVTSSRPIDGHARWMTSPASNDYAPPPRHVAYLIVSYL